ncbi:hypothetical protein QQY79_05660 [Flavobacterium tructae]|uniref:hypothetical protein n=1 Tax=Flavobacterium TaxID=237 RepID=UPI001F1A908D|nr:MULTISPECIES: hypothetical protein [Flavobacterium]MDL2141998.1 hypothetical protein [Flavobacterium tructae]URC10792.1 hypothetical protein M4I44_11890 [Flavobacterium sp. B183]
MKKILTLFAVAVVGLITFSSCEGPEGPVGPPGADSAIPYVYEVKANFVGPNYSVTSTPSGMLSGDNILVYELVSTSAPDSWALLPQVYYFNNGLETAQYNYTFSKNRVTIFITGSLSDYSQLPSSFRLGKVFRVVIIPGDDGINAKTGKKVTTDNLDYNAVIKKYNIDDSNVKQLN